MKNGKIELYDNQPIRTAWNETEEEWYFSVIDEVGVLTEQLLHITQSIPSKKAEPFDYFGVSTIPIAYTLKMS